MTEEIRIPCHIHYFGAERESHEAHLVCAATGEAICGDAHIGKDCGCDYFDLEEREFASVLYPDYPA